MILKTPTKWDQRFLDLAALISSWSKDPSTQVGAVITKGNNIISLGFNGFPKNIKDDNRYCDRDVKYGMCIHAEVNAILFSKCDLSGCTVYTYPFMPCHQCANLIIQSGIGRVVSYTSDIDRWAESFQMSANKFCEAGVDLTLYTSKDLDLIDNPL